MKYIITSILCLFLLNNKILFAAENDTIKNKPWVAMHLLSYTSDIELQKLAVKIPEFAEKGINVLILEVDYNFDFQSHPELRSKDSYITFTGARKFAKVCKQYNIRLIPEFQSLGHQSWAAYTFPLLTTYPELDLTPGAFPGNKDIYCREWDPTNPKVNELIFPLIEEIVDAFQADGIHLGMDEVFLLGSDKSPSTHGKDPAELFARVVNEFHDHFTKKKKLELFIWGDRLIDGKKYSYGEWESSMNGTAAAVDKIPKDIIICDWHYEPRDSYPSIPMFLEKGFKVLPCSHKNPIAAKALIKYSFRQNHPGMLGHLFTSWGSVPKDSILIYPAFVAGLSVMKEKKIWDVSISVSAVNPDGTLSIALASENKDLFIYYTTDGTEPGNKTLRYERPIRLDKNSVVKAIACKDGQVAGEMCSESFVVHHAIGKTIKFKVPPSIKYPPASNALVNGITSSRSFSDGQWSGFEGQDMEAIIELKEPKTISEVIFHCYYAPDSWIYPAERAEVWTSNDGINFRKAGEIKINQTSKTHEVAAAISLENVKASYVKVIVPKRLIPDGKVGGGSPAWIFIDELIVK